MFVVTMILPLTPHLTYVAWQPSQIFGEISCVGCCGDPQGLDPEEKHWLAYFIELLRFFLNLFSHKISKYFCQTSSHCL